MFYGNPVVNKNMKKKHHNFPLLATVGLVFGGSPSGRLFGDLGFHPGSCTHQQETQSSRWWGVSMSWCHSGGFHEFSRKISRALDGSFWVQKPDLFGVRFSGCEPTHRTGTHPKQPVTKTREKRHPFHFWPTGDCPNCVLGVCRDFM